MTETLRQEEDRRVIVSERRSNDTEYYAFWNPQYLDEKDSWQKEQRFLEDRRGCEHAGDIDAQFKSYRNSDGSLDGEEICTECDSRWPIKVDENNGRID